LALFAVWATALMLYARAPFSPLTARTLLALLCLVPAPWLLVALTLGEPSVSGALARWKPLVVSHVAGCTLAAAAMWLRGVDWITGIAAEPVTVLSQWGLIAAAVSSVSALAGLFVFALRLGSDASTTPALWTAAVGQIFSVLWVSTALLWRGYLSPGPLASASALGGGAAAVWLVSIVRTLPAARPLAPSRRLVYGASVAGLALAYLVVARFALAWALARATTAVPQVVPLAGFAAAAGLVVALGARHRVWVAVGRHVFRSKHDYGDVWIQLTALVSTARNAGDLVQRAAVFCRDLLRVTDVSVWLTDSTGRLARMDRVPEAADTTGGGADTDDATRRVATAVAMSITAQTAGPDAATFAQTIGASFACPMRVNGQLLGFIAVGSPTQHVPLDEEDRRVVRYISAQLGSALGLYRLGEQIADAREIQSFHRVSAFVLHDLKNLVAQQSFVLENAGRFRENPTFVADALAAFEDSTNRMRGLIGRLRSREMGGPAGTVPCDLLPLLRELIATPGIALHAGCTVRLVTADGVQACPVMVDRSAITQVLTNLLVNAVESLPAEAGDVALTIDRVDEGWRIRVRDNGQGIPEAFLRDHLFRPFRTTKETGFGIGLYQCKTIVEAARGTITITSQPGMGTTVTVTLPALPLTGDLSATDVEVHHGEASSSRC